MLEREAYPLILMYHHIAPPPAGGKIKGIYVTPGQFDWLLGWLKKRGYEFSSFADLNEPSGGNRVIITLDDGYLNNYTRAFPILRKHGARAVIYPIQDDLGKTGVSWPGATEQTPADMMDTDQVREMAVAGPEALLEAPILSIAYPYGAYMIAAAEQQAAER